MWNKDYIKLDDLSINSQIIHVMVHSLTSNLRFFIAIYASNDLSTRLSLWDHLIHLSSTIDDDWCVGGDFNEILKISEKFSRRGISNSRSNLFKQCMDHCNLMDRGFKEGKYTWTNKRYKNHLFVQDLENNLFKEYDQLLKFEEDFWKTKSRINWLSEGDANTRFFHFATLIRRKKNCITSLTNPQGCLISTKEDIQALLLNHFTNLYSTNQRSSILYLPSMPAITPVDSNLYIYHPLTDEEIHATFKSFGPLEAPGLDGLQPIFFQKYWDIMGQATFEFCKEVFLSKKIPHFMNTTYLCLIPKGHNADNPNKFRPISLCNTIYKLITKMIVNRLKPYLSNIINLAQASFFPSRRTADNAIITREYITHFDKMKGKMAKMTLKINLEKAFDKLEWSFIRDSLL